LAALGFGSLFGDRLCYIHVQFQWPENQRREWILTYLKLGGVITNLRGHFLDTGPDAFLLAFTANRRQLFSKIALDKQGIVAQSSGQSCGFSLSICHSVTINIIII
jgi:hypothetical protein